MTLVDIECCWHPVGGISTMWGIDNGEGQDDYVCCRHGEPKRMRWRYDRDPDHGP